MSYHHLHHHIHHHSSDDAITQNVLEWKVIIIFFSSTKYDLSPVFRTKYHLHFFCKQISFRVLWGRKRVYSKKALMTSLKKMARINMLSGSSLWGGSSAQINTKQTSGLFLKVWWRSSFGCSSLLSFCNSNCFRHKVNKKITFSFSSWGHPEGSVAYHLELRWIVKSAVSLISSCTKLSKRTFFHYETWKSGEISNAVVVISLFNECSLVYKISYKTNSNIGRIGSQNSKFVDIRNHKIIRMITFYEKPFNFCKVG